MPMVNRLPAVLIGGPPHAGKSVLFYSLTYALRERGIRHHAFRACPDGEGNWTQESDKTTVSQIRMPIKGEWPAAFVERICLDLEHRCFPLLVDMGGRPKESQLCLLRQCTHSLLLLRDDREDYTRLWLRLIAESGLITLAQIESQLEGTSTITSQTPILTGTLTGLVRNDITSAKGPLFDALVERIATLFNAASPQELEKAFLVHAPTKLVINLYASLNAIAPSTIRWEPGMLQTLLASVPTDVPLSVYGAGPNWVYAAISAHTYRQPLYQFDPRLPFGWIQPLHLQLSTGQSPEILVQTRDHQDVTVLSLQIPSKHLNYFQPGPLPFPPVRTDSGLIIDGITPFWLLTALVRLYKEAGVAWIAVYYPQSQKAIIVYTRVEKYNPGDAVPNPSV
jgi:CRISPR-associated protein Csx3